MNSSSHHVGITECRKLKFRILIIDIQHDVHTRALVDLGYVRIGCVSLVYVRFVHAQMVIKSASSTFHLMNSSNHHVDNTECRKLKFII
jgi:hypothetical protein